MRLATTSLPRDYRWPAEWEPHAATWIAWPHNLRTWPGHFAPIPGVFEQIIRTLARYEPVCLLAGGDEVRRAAQERVGQLDNVTLFDIPTNDVWIRDYGPTFVRSRDGRTVAAVQWQFNSWGGKYPPWDLDNAAGSAVARALKVPEFPTDSVLEGGSIDGNGHGALLTTRSCLLDPHRNADASQATLERLVREYLRVSEVIWIPGGPLAGDDTDGHVDQLARFVSEHQVVVALAEDRADANFEPLQRNFVALRDYGRRRSPELEIIPLPMPRPLYTDGQRVPASYCNFYVANGCVLVPAFDDPHDQRALAILADLFPDRDVIAMASRELVWGLGALHCMTQQQPATA